MTWFTDNPQFSECFNKTVMVWTPPVFLIVFSPIILYLFYKSRQRIDWNSYNKLRQSLSLIQIVFSTSELITVLIHYFQTDGRSSDEISSLPDIVAAFVRLFSSVRICLFNFKILTNFLLNIGIIIDPFLGTSSEGSDHKWCHLVLLSLMHYMRCVYISRAHPLALTSNL